jgi:hypothetical protein
MCHRSCFAIYTTGLIKWVEEYVSESDRLSLVDDVGCMETRSDVYHVVSILDRCPAKSIEWASRRGLPFDSAKREVALFTPTRGDRKHLRAKLAATICDGNQSV